MTTPALLDRSDILSDTSLTGSTFSSAYCDRIDGWIAENAKALNMPEGAALIAIGGYGRCDLAPESDLDIVLVHRKDVDIGEFAEKIWYPIWDSGIKLGHRVDTIDGLLELAQNDLETATALLTVRPIVGDVELAHDLALAGSEQWRADAATNAILLSDRVDQRHDQFGEVAFGLGPDLKNGRGGLRDVQSLMWAQASGVLAKAESEISLEAAHEVLLRARVALHRITGRAGDRLVLDFQDEVAEALGYEDADLLMADVAGAARSIAWASDAAWFWVARSVEPRRRSTDKEHSPNGIVIDGELLSIDEDADTTSPELLLDVAHTAATRHCFIDHETLERLASGGIEFPNPWTAEQRSRFTDLLRFGRPAINVIEAFDQVGLMSVIIPEWEPCRSKPQRNAYHRFTVDRHLIEAAAEAASLADRVERSDLLVLGALLHDIGKGYPGDHTDVGVDLIDTIGKRMGFDDDDTERLVDMCRYHLLLPDVATRRDLDDDGTISFVAEQAKSVEMLELLGALTEADSIATGPSAWNASKAELVRTLVSRVREVLQGANPTEVVGKRFPGPRELALLERAASEQDGFVVDISSSTITVVQNDRPGAFSRVAGVLTLSGLDIVGASALTVDGAALSQFVVHYDQFDIARLEEQLRLGTSGRMALEARVSERRHTYRRAFKRTSATTIEPQVTFDNLTSDYATVIEVKCHDQIGLLYRISRALSEIGIGILSARIQTIGDAVIDAFYVASDGEKILDENHMNETERAIIHSIRRK